MILNKLNLYNMSNPIENIIVTKGLPSITSSENADYTAWVERNKTEFLEKGISLDEAQNIYKDKLFISKFGREEYDRLKNSGVSNVNRDALYESTLLNEYAQENYGEDPRVAEIMNLSELGKRMLFQSDYKTVSELEEAKRREEERAKKAREEDSDNSFSLQEALLNLKDYKYAGVSTGVKETLISESNIKFLDEEQDKTLNSIIEKDKDIKLEASEPEYIQFKNYYSTIDSSTVEEEWEKIANGWNETIETPDGSIKVHIPGSDYYNTFKDSKWLDSEHLTYNEKVELLSRYKALVQKYGYQDALYYLDSTLQNKIAESQGFWVTTGKTAYQTIFTGVIPNFINGIASVPALFMSDKDAAEYLNSDFIQYLDKVAKYDTWDTDLQAEAERNNGISQRQVVWTKDQQNAWLSNKTFADIAEQSEFMIEMAATSYLTGGVGGVLGKGVSMVSKASKATKLISASSKLARGVDMAEDTLVGVGRITKMGADAMPVASLEARGVFTEVQDSNLAQINAKLEERAEAETIRQIQEDPYIQANIEALTDSLIKEFKEKYKDIDPNSINRESFRKQAEEDYYSYLMEENRNKFSPEYDADRDMASTMAADAFRTTFIASTIKTGAVNYGFRSFLNTLPFRKAIKAPTPKVQSKLNVEGLLETVPISNFSKYVQPVIKNTFGEGLDEVADEIIAAYGRGSGTGKFNAYLSNEYEGTNINEFVAGLAGGTSSAYNALYEENTWKAGLIGALSGAGNVSFNFNYANVKPINGEKFTTLELINKYVTNQVLHDIVENKAVEAETRRRNEYINKILEGYSSSFKDINGILHSISGMNAAVQTGNVQDAISAKHDASINLMMTLEHLSSDDVVGSSEIVKKVREVLESAAKGEITESEIDEFIGASNNRGSNISREEAAAEIQNNAKKLLDIQQKIIDTRSRLSRNTNFQSMDTKSQDAIIHNTLSIENARERIASIRENLGLTSNPKSSVIAGSVEDVDAQIESIQKEMGFLAKDRNRIQYSKYNKREGDPKTRKAKKLYIQDITKTLKELESRRQQLLNIEMQESGYSKTLSAKEIKALDATSFAHMMDPNNASLFSKEQQEQIDIVKEELKKKIANSDMHQHIGEDVVSAYANTLQSLQEHSNMVERMNDAILINGLNGESLIRLYEDIISVRRLERIKKKADGDAQENIAKHIYTPDGKVTQDTQKIIEGLLGTSNPEDIRKFINRRKSNLPIEVIDALEEVHNKALLLEDILSAAQNSEVQVNRDTAIEVRKAIQSIAASPNVKTIDDIINSLQVLVTDNSLDGEFKKAIIGILEELGGVIENKEIQEKLNTPIVPDSSDGNSSDVTTVEPEVKLTPEEEKKIEPEVPKVKPEDMQRGDTNPNAESELITFALNLASKGINGYTKETRDRVVGIINNASPYYTKEELSEYLLAEANRLDTKSSNEDDMMASSLLRQCASKVSNRKDSNNDSTRERGTYTPNVFDRTSPRASSMQSLNMEQITKKYPNSPNAKLYEKYRVREFLESGQITNKTPVVFISDPEFIKEVENSMTSNGANVTMYSLPLVAAVEVESGGIEIDGKQYQPIAIMPSTDSQTRRGAARLGDIRTRAYRQKDSGKVELVKDEDGIVITTTISGNVNAAPPRQLEMYEPNRSAQTLLINDASESDRRELQNLSKADGRRSPIYQKLKSAFLSRLSHRKVEKGEELVYKVPNLKRHTGESEFEEIPIIALLTPSHKTVDRNSDRLIVDLLKEGDKSALYSNSRIIRYTKALNKFFSETFNTSEFSFEQDENGNVIPTESTIKQLREYSTQLDSKLGNFLNIPPREGWKYQIESTGNVVDGKIEYKLSIQDSYGNTIDLSTLTEGRVSEDTQLEIIRNLMIDSNTGEARMRNDRDGFVIWNVLFADAGSSSEGAKNNMADIFDDDIIEFSKESLKYTIEGVTINAPFSGEGQPLYKKGNQRTATSWSRTSENSYEVSTAGDKRFSAMVAKFNPGTIIEGVDVGGMTIEQVYQSVIKKSRKGQPPAEDSMINRLVIESQLSEEARRDFYSTNKEDWSYRIGYLPLWQEWAKQNPQLIEELREKSAGKTLTDKFANTRVSQARALAEILNSNQHSSSTLYTDNEHTENVSINTDTSSGVVNVGSTIIDADTGSVIEGTVQSESIQEQIAEVESKPVEAHIPGKVRNRFDDSLDSKTSKKTVSPKYQWGVFEGAKMSVDEITDALFDQDILTEEDWNNLSEQEKDRVLKCCGAL